MRLGELQALRWQDVDLDSKMLQVRHMLTRTPAGLLLTEPKSLRSRRRIALSPTAVEALLQHRRKQSEERLKLGPAWDDRGLVFANAVGRAMEAGNILRRSFWPLLLDKAGMERRRFHDLRHTCATLILRQGVHAKVVSELLGYSSIGLTLDTYSHVLPDMQ